MGLFQVPVAENSAVRSYLPGSIERSELTDALGALRAQPIDIPMIIGGSEVRTSVQHTLRAPHELSLTLGSFHEGDGSHVHAAIEAALAARSAWSALPWHDRAAIFLKAAELLEGPYRQRINATTMLGQSKNVHQAEIDAACELVDFLRFNVAYMEQIYSEQPRSNSSVWNQLEYRGLEGFVLAITPFNFTSIAANLACAPALMGNAVIWKPAYPQIYSAKVVMDVLHQAGLPEGVINLIYVDGPVLGEVVFGHPEFAGLHFTGSTQVFKQLWRSVGENIDVYRQYPRLVGETGGKDFIVAHKSADIDTLCTAIVRGGYEYQGQKCSAASRIYVPKSIWSELKPKLLESIESIQMGSVEDWSNFMNAVISEAAFDKIQSYLHAAQEDEQVTVLAGGLGDKSQGYFIPPTLLECAAHDTRTMCEEIFGPVVSVFVYPDNAYEDILTTIDETSPYGLTGAIFAQSRQAIRQATQRLQHSAGNFYINDKPTGAVVGHQPFGGARASGTNDKAGACFNLIRWTSPRTIKEVFVPPTQYPYPFMQK